MILLYFVSYVDLSRYIMIYTFIINFISYHYRGKSIQKLFQLMKTILKGDIEFFSQEMEYCVRNHITQFDVVIVTGLLYRITKACREWGRLK